MPIRENQNSGQHIRRGRYLILDREALASLAFKVFNAAKLGNIKRIRELLIPYMGHPQMRDIINWKNPRFYDSTALIQGSVHGHPILVRELIRFGADVNLGDADGDTSLIWAARWNRIDVIKILLRDGADIAQVNNYGRSALAWATSCGHVDAIKLLKIRGAKQRRGFQGGVGDYLKLKLS